MRWPTIRGLRWWIVGLISLGTIVNYLARNALAVLAPQLTTVLHFSTREYSYVIASFQLGYTVMQPVCGAIIDRIGLRLGFALFAVVWSLASMLHGLATGWLSLAACRGLLGVSEAVAIPAGVKTIAEWFAPKERSVAVGYFNAGTSIGAVLAPPLVIGLALMFDWRAAFVATGLAGLVWAALWWACYRPSQTHPALGVDERARIPVPPPGDAAARTPLLRMLSSRRFWAIAIPRFLAEPAWQTFNFWIPLYLATERHWDLKHIALFAWAPFLAADLGGILGGYLSPFVMRRFKLKLIASRVAGVVVGAVLMIGPSCVGLAFSPYLAIGLFCLGGLGHQMISGLINTLSADVFASHEVGAANGWIGAAGWTGGLLFSLVVGAFADRVGYGPLFACVSVFDIIGAGLLILLIRGVTASAPGELAV